MELLIVISIMVIVILCVAFGLKAFDNVHVEGEIMYKTKEQRYSSDYGWVDHFYFHCLVRNGKQTSSKKVEVPSTIHEKFKTGDIIPIR